MELLGWFITFLFLLKTLSVLPKFWIEVYPLGTEIVPGYSEELRAYIQNTAASQSTATHAMLSVPINVEQIEQIAAREDWLVQRTSFGFDFMMLWVENRLLIELLTPEMTAQYMAFTQRENLRNYFVFPDSPDAPTSWQVALQTKHP